MVAAADPVPDDPGYLQIPIEIYKTAYQRSGASSHRACIYDKEYGQAEEFCKARGGACIAFPVDAVKKAHNSFDYHHVGLSRLSLEYFEILLWR